MVSAENVHRGDCSDHSERFDTEDGDLPARCNLDSFQNFGVWDGVLFPVLTDFSSISNGRYFSNTVWKSSSQIIDGLLRSREAFRFPFLMEVVLLIICGWWTASDTKPLPKGFVSKSCVLEPTESATSF